MKTDIEALAPIGQRIMAAALEAGIENQNQLAVRLGQNRQTINRWVHGDTGDMKHENLFQLADLLKVSARWIALEQGPKRLDDPLSPEHRKLLDLAQRMSFQMRAHWTSIGITLLQGGK